MKVHYRRTENNGAEFTEYDCLCGAADCKKKLAPALGVTKGTITLGIRAHGTTIVQIYLDRAQTLHLMDELRGLLETLARAEMALAE